MCTFELPMQFHKIKTDGMKYLLKFLFHMEKWLGTLTKQSSIQNGNSSVAYIWKVEFGNLELEIKLSLQLE